MKAFCRGRWRRFFPDVIIATITEQALEHFTGVCVYIYIYIYIFFYIYLYLYLYLFIYVFIYLFIYVLI